MQKSYRFFILFFFWLIRVNESPGQTLSYATDSVTVTDCTIPITSQIKIYNNTSTYVLGLWYQDSIYFSNSGNIFLIIDPYQYGPSQQGFFDLGPYDSTRVIVDFIPDSIAAGDSAIYRIALYDPLDSLQTYKVLTFIWTCNMTNIDNHEHGINYNIYPNPANDLFTIQLNSPEIKNYSYRISDVSGSLLRQETIFTNSFSVDISSLDPGFYLLSIIDPAGLVSTSKIIRQ